MQDREGMANFASYTEWGKVKTLLLVNEDAAADCKALTDLCHTL